jgi:hypothetical protein
LVGDFADLIIVESGVDDVDGCGLGIIAFESNVPDLFVFIVFGGHGGYSNTHDGDNPEEDLESELSGAEETRALAQLSGNQTLADVATLYEAMHGGITGWGTDEDAIMRTLRGKPEEERMRIIEEYRRQYDVDLTSDLNSELGGHELERAEALIEGDTARADAIAIDAAMRGGWTGWGTDEAAIEVVYAEERREVAAEATQRGWTTAQMVRTRHGSRSERPACWQPGRRMLPATRPSHRRRAAQ